MTTKFVELSAMSISAVEEQMMRVAEANQEQENLNKTDECRKLKDNSLYRRRLCQLHNALAKEKKRRGLT